MPGTSPMILKRIRSQKRQDWNNWNQWKSPSAEFRWLKMSNTLPAGLDNLNGATDLHLEGYKIRITDTDGNVETVSIPFMKTQTEPYAGLEGETFYMPFEESSRINFDEKNIAKCMSCGEGGSPINFLRKIKNISFEEAAETLAERAGIQIKTVKKQSATNR